MGTRINLPLVWTAQGGYKNSVSRTEEDRRADTPPSRDNPASVSRTKEEKQEVGREMRLFPLTKPYCDPLLTNRDS